VVSAWRRKIGEESLIGRETDEEIVAAETKCCSFLDLALEECGGELTLAVAALQDGQVVADELAAAFAGAWA
jgi:hypothetical protein